MKRGWPSTAMASGVLLGAVLALAAFAPAAWLALRVAEATGQRLLLADARGTLWRGSAQVVLSGGAESRDAAALPGRVEWTVGIDGWAFGLRARQACCINGELRLRWLPGLARSRFELLSPTTGPNDGPGGAAALPDIGQWPASLLAGLGTPWNTLQPSGTLRLASPGLQLEQVQGRWRFSGQAVLALDALASRVSTLPVLGSYRLAVDGDGGAGPARLLLSTTAGALQLQGSGSLLGASGPARLRFNGQASAAPGFESVLANLLSIIGRRQGAVSVISIG